MGYTWAQFTGYLALARRRSARRRLDAILDLRAAFHGGTGARDLQRALTKAAESRG